MFYQIDIVTKLLLLPLMFLTIEERSDVFLDVYVVLNNLKFNSDLVMSISATTSNVYVNYYSFLSQGNNKSLSALQSVVANYGANAFQVSGSSASNSDILDISVEGLTLLNALQSVVPAGTTDNSTETDNTETGNTSTGNTETVSDVSLNASEISEAERVEIIRVNKNAVLERVNELLEEKGIEVSAEQSFDLTTNFLDGSVSVTGIADPELAAAVNEALAGDAELIARMQKTRDELGLAEPANTVSRNFTIGFDSMIETPEDAELEYVIDLFVNQPVAVLPEETAGTEVANTEVAGTEAAEATTVSPAFYLSIILSNKLNSEANLIEALNNNEVAQDDNEVAQNDKEVAQDDNEEQNANNETVLSKTPDFIPEAESSDETAETVSTILPYSIFGSYFQASSVAGVGADGVTLDWNLQFSNWNIAGNTANNANTETTSETQQIFETLNIGGSAFYAADPQQTQTLEEQAALYQSQFINEFSQGLDSAWVKNFITQNGLNTLGLFNQ
jgi:hypothetical protein